MMQRNKLKLLLASLAASTIFCSVSITVTAADPIRTGLSGNETVLIEAHKGACPGHIITQSSQINAHTILVQSGSHKINLSGQITLTPTTAEDATGSTNMAEPAFRIAGTSQVELTLEEDCNATFESPANYAGIQVDGNAKLTIKTKTKGKGTLKVTGGDYAAGIGGGPRSSVGSIEIFDGDIEATGGKGAAGIGSGLDSGANNVIIRGGSILAQGGDSYTRGTSDPDDPDSDLPPAAAGPGIGSTSTATTGNVIISGGIVKTFAGNNTNGPDETTISGIQAQFFSSDTGSANIYSNDLTKSGMTSGFNGIVWKVPDKDAIALKADVYGNANLTEDLQDNQKLFLQPGSSLTIVPPNADKDENAKINIPPTAGIKGDSTNKIVDVNKIGGGGSVDPDIRNFVSLALIDFENVTKEHTFTGEDFTDTFLVYNKKRNVDGFGVLDVDATNWSVTKEFLPNIENITLNDKKTQQVKKQGNYKITYKHKNLNNNLDFDKEFVMTGVKIAQRKLEECEISISDQTYTGSPLEPDVSISYNGIPIPQEGNYTVTYPTGKNVEKGKGLAIIQTIPTGDIIYADAENLANEFPKEFEIKAASLTDATVIVGPDVSTVYDGKEHKLGDDYTITVKVGDKTLKEGDDYTIEPETDDFTNAGTISYLIKGNGNYDGTPTQPATFTITAMPLNIESIAAEKEKTYNGDAKVKISDVTFKETIPDKDKNKITISSPGLVDKENLGNAGPYDNIYLSEPITIEVDGKPSENYDIKYDGSALKLDETITIKPLDPTPTPVSFKAYGDANYKVGADGKTFDCTVEIPAQSGVKTYQFKMDENGEWKTATLSEDKTKYYADFTGIIPESKHIFYANVTADPPNVNAADMLPSEELVFEKLVNPAADISVGELYLDPPEGNSDKKTYTVAIPEVENPESPVEYWIKASNSEDSPAFSATSFKKADCKPGTEYIGYIRYAETTVYKATEKPFASQPLKTPKSPLADSGPKYKTTWKRVIPNNSDNIELPDALKEADYTSMQEVTTDLTRHLAGLGAYQDQEHTAFYDVKVQVITRDDAGEPVTRDAEPGDFENGGIPITLPAKSLPDGVVATENQFSAAHMFASNDFAEYSAGEIETCLNSEGSEVFQGSGKGVTFVVNGTSPVGIAWSTAPEEPTDPEDPNNPNNPEDPNNPDNNDPNNPDGNDPNNPNGTDPNNPDGNNGDANAADPNANNAADPNAANANGTDANGEDAKSAAQSAVDALKSAAASLLPKTGDTSKIIMWVVAAVAACIAVIAVLRSKAKKGKKAKSSSSAKTSATVKKPAATTAKKSASTTAKKTTTKKPASGTAKKTTTTKKGR